MNLSPKQLLRRSRAFLGCGLAVVAAVIATAEPAAAQRRSHGDVWRSTSASYSTASYGAGYGSGRYESRSRRVWVPGHSRQVWVAPIFEWRYDFCGNRTQVQIRAGHYRTQRNAGHYETRTERVWVPARRVRVDRRRHHDHGRQKNRVTHVGRRYRG